ncbi:MAG: hypothetical protein ACK5O7_00005 [Holosporales bacterium]
MRDSLARDDEGVQGADRRHGKRGCRARALFVRHYEEAIGQRGNPWLKWPWAE